MTSTARWIIAIVALLGGNVLAMTILAISATHGPPQVIPEYYDRAVHYDDTLDRSTASHALGWTVDVAIADRVIEVVGHDAAGAPLEGGHVHVTGYQRAHLADAIELELVAVGGGRYRATPPLDRRGVHDLTITVARGSDRFTRFATIEAP